MLHKEWRRLKSAKDTAEKAAWARVRAAVGVLYRGKPFLEATTRLADHGLWLLWASGTLEWDELELPEDVVSDLRDSFGVAALGCMPDAGAVFNGYGAPDVIAIGLTDDDTVLQLLRWSAREDTRAAADDDPLALSPSDRARWRLGLAIAKFRKDVTSFCSLGHEQRARKK
jgi:hypothetical protein